MQPSVDLNHTVRRTLALVGVFGVLVVLLLATALTSEAFVKSTGHDTLDDFVQGRFSHTGLLQIPPDMQSVQLMPSGLIGDWAAGASLNAGLRDLAAGAAGGHIVVMGGNKGTDQWTDEVWISTIQANGSPGAWQEQANSLPHPVAGAAAASHTPEGADYSWIYLLGGTARIGGFTRIFTDVLRTTLDHTTGTVGPWTSVEGLPIPTKNSQAAAVNGYLYLVGGIGFDFGYYTSEEVYYAPINGDGSLGAWQRTSDLPEPLDSHLVVSYQDPDALTLYVIGGRDSDLGTRSAHVYYADVDPTDGTLTPWAPELGPGVWPFGDLPLPLYGHSGAAINDAIMVTGGVEEEEGGGDTGTVPTVKAALVEPGEPNFRLYNWCGTIPWPDCTIGAWEAGPLLPAKRAFHATVSYGPYIYTMGGVEDHTGPGSGQPVTSVYWGSVVADTLDARYAPEGYYISPEIDLKVPRTPRRVEWDVTMSNPGKQTLDLTYRSAGTNHVWGDWQVTDTSDDGLNGHDIAPETGDIRYFQYRVDFTTALSRSSPLLNKVDLYYEVDDPEVEVRKNTGIVISAELGTVLNYTIYYTNNGGVAAENVVLTETLPAYTTYAGGTAWHRIGSTAVYTYLVGDLGSGETKHAFFAVRVNTSVPAGVDTIDNVVDIGFPPMEDELGEMVDDPEPDNNHYEFSNPLSRFSVTVSKSAQPIPGTLMQAGQQIKYTLTYENTGQETLTGLVLEDALHSQVSYVAGSIWPAAKGDDSNATKLKWTIGTLAPGAKGTAGFTVKIKANTADGTIITNQFSAVSNQTLSKKSATVAHPVGTTAPQDLSISKSADPVPGTEVFARQQIKYTLTFENTGQETLTGLVLEDALPSQVSYVAGSIWPAAQGYDSNPQKLTWIIGSLAPGEIGTAGFTVKVRDGTAEGTIITNQFSAASDQTWSIASETVSHPVGAPEPPAESDLKLSKTANPGDYSQVAPGAKIDYTLTYENTGDEALTGLELIDALSEDVTYVAGSIWPAAKGNDSDPGQLTWTIGNLAPGAKGTAGFSVKVEDDLPGSVRITNMFTGQSDQIDLVSSNVVHHDTYIEGPDLVVTKIVAETTEPQIGQPFNLVVTVKNQGNQDCDDGEFWVEVYVKPYPGAWPTGPDDHEMGYCLDGNCTRAQHVEYIDSLAAGQSYDFRFKDISLPGGGINQVFAQADICFVGYYCRDPRYGWYLEQNEHNNIASAILNGNVVTLPMIPKNH